MPQIHVRCLDLRGFLLSCWWQQTPLIVFQHVSGDLQHCCIRTFTDNISESFEQALKFSPKNFKPVPQGRFHETIDVATKSPYMFCSPGLDIII